MTNTINGVTRQMLERVVEEGDRGLKTFMDDPNGPGGYYCPGCDGYDLVTWKHGHIIDHGKVMHDADCWLEEARALLTAAQAAEDSEQEAFKKALHSQTNFKLTADNIEASEWAWHHRASRPTKVNELEEARALLATAQQALESDTATTAAEGDTVAVDRRMLQEVLRDLPSTNLIAGYFRRLLAGSE